VAEINILSEEKISDSTIAFEVESPFPLPSEIHYGIDPGTTNLGIAVVRPNQSVRLYKVTLKRQEKALDRLLSVQQVLGHTIKHFTLDSKAVIEGASFGARYRQVELAEVRAAILLWFYGYKIEAEIVPPKTIRKVVFGNGNIKNPWDNLQDDIAAALGCAFYSSNILSSSS